MRERGNAVCVGAGGVGGGEEGAGGDWWWGGKVVVGFREYYVCT